MTDQEIDTSLAGAKIVSVGADGSMLLDMPTGGDRKRVWLPGLLTAQQERDEAIEALRPFVLERSKLSSGPNELVCTEDASHLIRASEIVKRHDERKKGSEQS
jgi:hypothetical protein